MKKINYLLFTLLAIVSPVIGFAQNSDIEMADTMRSNGKIFVVIGVIGIILVGILIFLLLIDKKVRILEKNSKIK
ncbi:MAG TPA: CcmD family protein [Bacteroidia bacterium]|nr:CcmD family protein [Bacteroidota bacterium]MBP9791517.1 CcmD family protein [Bacteroidia bacterium]MBK7572140.1 CcmD family protein [Bacteroidota bacterium]MBK8584071.1 CcmD family protein [Bacteroidota bacterium]MBP9922285.1 CcmD family protein [Bacteroidia bacterium]